MGSGPLLLSQITTPPLQTSRLKSPKDLIYHFGEIFPETNATVSYNPQTPAITSSSTSHWEVGLPGSFAIQASDATALSVAGLPGNFRVQCHHSRMIHGTPLDGNRTNLTITASNPVQGSVQQIHLLKIFDSSDFAASLHLAVDAKSLGGLPSDYPELGGPV